MSNKVPIGLLILILVSCRRWSARLHHVLEQLEARLGRGLALRQRQVGQHGRVADQARVSVAHDVGLPLPARRVGVAGANVLLLEALELLLRAKFVGLEEEWLAKCTFLRGELGRGNVPL